MHASGGQTLRYSKVSVIGQGRAGKSTLIRSILGHEFKELDTTVGVEAGMYEVNHHNIQGVDDSWSSYDPRERCLLKEVQAQMMAEVILSGKLGGSFKESILVALAPKGGAPSSDEPARDMNSSAVQNSVQASQAEGGDGVSAEVTADTVALQPAVAQQCPLFSVETRDSRRETFLNPESDRDTVPISMLPSQEDALDSSAELTEDAAALQPLEQVEEPSHQEASLDIDTTLLDKFLNLKGGDSECIKLLLEDFGGQDNFYEIYSILFSEYAVYVLVFNMEWLLPGSADMESGIRYLRHWLHTLSAYCRITSILLVGTHKDKVQEPREHEYVNNNLYDALRDIPAWHRVVWFQEGEVSTGRAPMAFFPVDNTKGNADPVISKLMKQIDQAIRGSDHLRHKVPFAWMGLIDRLEALKQENCLLLEFDQFRDMCKKSGFPSAPPLDLNVEVELALNFLHKLGLLMYHSAVPNLVILRPAEFLFPYFTKIICDFRWHSSLIPEHQAARKAYPELFHSLSSKGILSNELFTLFWKGRAYHDEMKQLMVSLGLMVPILANLDGDSDQEFLVPAILPEDRDCTPPSESVLTSYILFGVSSSVASWEKAGYLPYEVIRREAHVPAGVFSRLLGSLASLCQQTEPYPTISHMSMKKNACSFELGTRIKFSLIKESYLISVHIEQGTGYGVSEIVQGQLTAIVEKFLPGFSFLLAVPTYNEGCAILSGHKGIKSRTAKNEAMKISPTDILTPSELCQAFKQWIVPRGLEDWYHFFLSYRWNHFDEELTMSLYMELSLQIAEDNAAPRTFLDKMRLETGGNLVTDFGYSLCRSKIAVVFLSAEALKRMSEMHIDTDKDVSYRQHSVEFSKKIVFCNLPSYLYFDETAF